jgi:hypothetical protein
MSHSIIQSHPLPRSCYAHAYHTRCADFLDVHVYPEATGSQATFLETDLASVEWPEVQSTLPKMAVLMGEFGTYEGTFKDVVAVGVIPRSQCSFDV